MSTDPDPTDPPPYHELHQEKDALKKVLVTDDKLGGGGKPEEDLELGAQVTEPIKVEINYVQEFEKEIVQKGEEKMEEKDVLPVPSAHSGNDLPPHQEVQVQEVEVGKDVHQKVEQENDQVRVATSQVGQHFKPPRLEPSNIPQDEGIPISESPRNASVPKSDYRGPNPTNSLDYLGGTFSIKEVFLSESQYAMQSVSSCTVMALEMSLRTTHDQEISDSLVQNIIHFGGRYELNQHTGFDDVFPLFTRYTDNLEICFKEQENFKNFSNILGRCKSFALKNKQSIAVILTKPPESLSILFKYSEGYLHSYLFDSHGRPEVWGPYAGLIRFESPIALEDFICKNIWSVLDLGPDAGYMAEMYNLIDVAVVSKKKDSKIMDFDSLSDEDKKSFRSLGAPEDAFEAKGDEQIPAYLVNDPIGPTDKYLMSKSS
jgi:hypothetical protein